MRTGSSSHRAGSGSGRRAPGHCPRLRLVQVASPSRQPPRRSRWSLTTRTRRPGGLGDHHDSHAGCQPAAAEAEAPRLRLQATIRHDIHLKFQLNSTPPPVLVMVVPARAALRAEGGHHRFRAAGLGTGRLFDIAAGIENPADILASMN